MGLVAGLLELVLPTRCAGCERPGTLVCDACRNAMPVPQPHEACPRCGAPGGRRHCAECPDTVVSFSVARCAGVLERPLSRMITVYKDGRERRLSVELGTRLASAIGTDWAAWADALVWVPAGKSALTRRGFDHMERLANVVSESLGVPSTRMLVSGSSLDQRGLGREERRKNAMEAFVILSEIRVPPRLILIDDVMTTGATLDAAAAALSAAGACEVRAAVLARAVTSGERS